MLRKLDEGEVSFDQALRKVELLRALRAAIWAALPHMDRTRSVFEAAEQFFGDDKGHEWRRLHAELMLDMAAFLTISRNDFGVGVELATR